MEDYIVSRIEDSGGALSMRVFFVTESDGST